MLKKLLMNIVVLICVVYGANADARMVIIPTAKPHYVRRVTQDDRMRHDYKIDLLTKLIGEEVEGHKIIDCFVEDDRLYFVLFKDGEFYRANVRMDYTSLENKDFRLKVGQLFNKKLEQEQFGDGNVSEDSK